MPQKAFIIKRLANIVQFLLYNNGAEITNFDITTNTGSKMYRNAKK